MSDLNAFITEKVVPFREKCLEIIKKEHPILYKGADLFLKGRGVRIGFQVLENSTVVGIYTFALDGIHIAKVEKGTLDPSFKIPLIGDIRLYGVMERKDLEEMLNDPGLLNDDILKNSVKYLHSFTLKFL